MNDMAPTEEFTKACKEAERRPIPGYEGFYDATTDGKIISCARTIVRSNGRPLIKKERVMRPGWTHSGRGYRTVTLSKDNKAKCFTVHTLVALTFMGPRPEGMQVCHNDGDPSNNALSNLRYDTPSGNNADKQKHGTAQIGDRAGNSKLIEDQVLEIRRQLKVGRKQRDVAAEFSVSKSLIAAISVRKVWTHV